MRRARWRRCCASTPRAVVQLLPRTDSVHIRRAPSSGDAVRVSDDDTPRTRHRLVYRWSTIFGGDSKSAPLACPRNTPDGVGFHVDLPTIDRCESHSLRQRRGLAPLHDHHVLGSAGAVAGKRVLRPRAWGVHGCRLQASQALESADGGTVFLDEIGEWSPGAQAKLLRVIEEKTFKRVGGSADIHVDVRVVAATNRNLEKRRLPKADSGATCSIDSMSCRLRCRRSARTSRMCPFSWCQFIDGFNAQFRKKVPFGASPAAYTLLQHYGWPGNVREMRNVVERAMLLSDGTRLEARDFAALTGTAASPDAFALPANGVNLEQLERSLVIQALKRSAGNQTRAAGLLGLNRDQIRYRIEKFGLTPAPTALIQVVVCVGCVCHLTDISPGTPSTDLVDLNAVDDDRVGFACSDLRGGRKPPFSALMEERFGRTVVPPPLRRSWISSYRPTITTVCQWSLSSRYRPPRDRPADSPSSMTPSGRPWRSCRRSCAHDRTRTRSVRHTVDPLSSSQVGRHRSAAGFRHTASASVFESA